MGKKHSGPHLLAGLWLPPQYTDFLDSRFGGERDLPQNASPQLILQHFWPAPFSTALLCSAQSFLSTEAMCMSEPISKKVATFGDW